MTQHPIVEKWLQFAAYVILAASIVFGAFKIEHEVRDAHHERCVIIHAQLSLAALEINNLQAQGAAPDMITKAQNDLVAARTKVDTTC